MKKLLSYLIVILFLAAFISAKPKCPKSNNNCCLVTKVSVSSQPRKKLQVVNEPEIHPLYIMTSGFE